MPIRPTSGAATSRTRAANWSRSRYTSSTVRVPENKTEKDVSNEQVRPWLTKLSYR